MAVPKEGHELLQVTVTSAAAKWVKVQAALEGLPPGQVVERVLRAAMEHSSILDLVLNETGRPLQGHDRFGGIRATRQNALPKPTAKAPGKPSGATGAAKATPASDEARVNLWQALEATREAEGWKDPDIAERLGIATRNVSQWRKAGMVTSTKVEAVTKLLAQDKAKP
jgi:hypothetical protein